jgi:coproporphyrinogen III oxidase-like Fe-S oxidoreductase
MYICTSLLTPIRPSIDTRLFEEHADVARLYVYVHDIHIYSSYLKKETSLLSVHFCGSAPTLRETEEENNLLKSLHPALYSLPPLPSQSIRAASNIDTLTKI